MNDYVVGFLFGRSLREVALIRKQSPDWQKGLLNGIGGKVERGEDFRQAMVREFKEETGALVEIDNWVAVGTLIVRDPIDSVTTARVAFFTARGDYPLSSPTVEPVAWYCPDLVLSGDVPHIPNLDWLIPMALLKWKKPNWMDSDSTFVLSDEKASCLAQGHVLPSYDDKILSEAN